MQFSTAPCFILVQKKGFDYTKPFQENYLNID